MPSKTYQFVEQLFSLPQPPQTATVSVNGYNIVIQYIPQQGFVVGYQDSRVKENNYTMVWADIVFEDNNQKKLNAMTPDQLREHVMNSPDLFKQEGLLLEPPPKNSQHLIPDGSQRKLTIKEGEMSPPVDIPMSISELVEVIEQVAEKAEEMYNINSVMYLKDKN